MKPALAVTICVTLFAAASQPSYAATHARQGTGVRLHHVGGRAHKPHAIKKLAVAAAPPVPEPIPVPVVSMEPYAWRDVFYIESSISPIDGMQRRPPLQADTRDLRASLSNRGVNSSAGRSRNMPPSEQVSLYQTVWHQALPRTHAETMLFVSSPAYFGLHK